jgi:hypothetical protein
MNRAINQDSVEIILANHPPNVLMIALAESWLLLHKKNVEAEEYIKQLEGSVDDWETLAGQREDELKALQEERFAAPRPRSY